MLILLLVVVVVSSLCGQEVVVGVGFWTDLVLRSAVHVPSVINDKVSMARSFVVVGGSSSLTALHPCWLWLVVFDVCASSLECCLSWWRNSNVTMAVARWQSV